MKAITADGDRIIAGSLMTGQLRVLQYNEYPVDLPIGGHLLIMEYPDRPGMVGKYGIACWRRTASTSPAWRCRASTAAATRWCILTLDDPVPPPVFDADRRDGEAEQGLPHQHLNSTAWYPPACPAVRPGDALAEEAPAVEGVRNPLVLTRHQ